SAAVPSAAMRNSTSTLSSSWSAFSVPRRAMVQKSDALLVTKASRSFLPPAFDEGEPVCCRAHPQRSAVAATRAASASADLFFICFSAPDVEMDFRQPLYTGAGGNVERAGAPGPEKNGRRAEGFPPPRA